MFHRMMLLTCALLMPASGWAQTTQPTAPAPQQSATMETITVHKEADMLVAAQAMRAALHDSDLAIVTEKMDGSFHAILAAGEVRVVVLGKHVPPHDYFAMTLVCVAARTEDAAALCDRLTDAVPAELIFLPPHFAPTQTPPSPATPG
jgi:hypothetical protein